MAMTIGIAVYNGLPHLMESMASALRLSISTDVKVIVVDDGSTDESVGWLRRSCGEGTIEVIEHRRNLGIAATYQRLLESCDTDHLLLLNQDDVLLPHADRTIRRVIARPTAEEVHVFNGWIIDVGGKRQRPIYKRPPFVATTQGAGPALQRANFVKSPSQVIFPTGIARDVGGFLFSGSEGQGAEDWLLWHRLSRAGLSFVLHVLPAVAYRMHDRNASHSPDLSRSMAAVSKHVLEVADNGHSRLKLRP